MVGGGRDLEPWLALSRGQVFDVLMDLPEDRYLIRDDRARLVAVLDDALGGEAFTHDQIYRFSIERQRGGWSVAVRSSQGGGSIGRACPRWVPGVSELRGSWGRWRMTPSLLTGSYLLWSRRSRIARVALTAFFHPTGTIRGNRPLSVGSVQILNGPSSGFTNDGLPILLALEMIKALKAVPRVDAVNSP